MDDAAGDAQTATAATVRAFLEHSDTGADGLALSGAQFNMARKSLLALYRMLSEDGDVVESPMNGIKPRVLAPTCRPPLRAEQLCALMHGDDGREALRVRNDAILATLINTGMRVSECARLNCGDITPSRRSLAGILTKGGKRRAFSINDVLRESLDVYLRARMTWRTVPDDDGPRALFLSATGRRLGARQIQNIVRARGALGGIEALSPHDLRAGVATLLFEEGIDMRSIQQFLGHERLETTFIYIARLQRADSAASAALGALLTAA
ncbi:MAG: tyrosine-type recombinase/integrase [Deltaproteobacteria bacterium]